MQSFLNSIERLSPGVIDPDDGCGSYAQNLFIGMLSTLYGLADEFEELTIILFVVEEYNV